MDAPTPQNARLQFISELKKAVRGSIQWQQQVEFNRAIGGMLAYQSAPSTKAPVIGDIHREAAMTLILQANAYEDNLLMLNRMEQENQPTSLHVAMGLLENLDNIRRLLIELLGWNTLIDVIILHYLLNELLKFSAEDMAYNAENLLTSPVMRKVYSHLSPGFLCNVTKELSESIRRQVYLVKVGLVYDSIQGGNILGVETNFILDYAETSCGDYPTPYFCALDFGNLEALDFLLLRCPIPTIANISESNFTLLHYAATKRNPHFTETILSHLPRMVVLVFIDRYSSEPNRQSALHLAVELKNFDVVLTLCAYGATYTLIDGKDQVPANIAVRSIEINQFFTKLHRMFRGASIGNNAEFQDLNTYPELYKKGLMNARDGSGRTATEVLIQSRRGRN